MRKIPLLVIHLFFSIPIPLSSVCVASSTSPLSLSPPLSPALIERSSRTINIDLNVANENIPSGRLHIVSSPASPSILTGEATSSSMNSHIDDCVRSPVLLDIDLDVFSKSKKTTIDYSKTNLSRSPESSSTTNIKSGASPKIWIVNSLQSLISLNERTVISLVNNPSLPITNLISQSSISQSGNSHSLTQTNQQERLHIENLAEK